MRLIGIKLISAEPVVRKSLKTNSWYPFGYELVEPNMDDLQAVAPHLDEIDDIYQIDERLPKVSVQCIVGMNGSGKTSLLDILFRIINNFALVALKSDEENMGRDLQFAFGLTAKLYFETDGTVGCIYNGRKPKEMYLEYGQNQLGLTARYNFEDFVDNRDLSRDLLSKFFYTVNTNYSTYAYNENDYRKDVIVGDRRQKTNVNGKWLGGLFHKNDGYQAPLVMTPYRKNFNIDINRESKLSIQRIVTLSLMLFSQKEDGDFEYGPNDTTHPLGKLLISDQVPEVFTFEFDKNFIKHLPERTYKLFGLRGDDTSTKIIAEALLRLFEEGWRNTVDITRLPLKAEADTALRYLAYKSIKIGSVYSTFVHEFNFMHVIKEIKKLIHPSKNVNEENYDYAYIIDRYIGDARHLIDAIIAKPSHITLKIRQCVEYIRRAGSDGVSSERLRGQMLVDDFLADRYFDTYDQMVMALPPAFFKLDIWYRPRQTKFSNAKPIQLIDGAPSSDHFSLGQMSSGQKQWQNCLSYICYHIKNIESVSNDDNRIPYHHINLVFDEAELYYHPEYQRTFVHRLLKGLANCHIDRTVINSINILIATHSPFILSDILTENTLYLKNGNVAKVEGQTFGANYYDILRNSFFLEKRAVGEIAAQRIGEWVERMNANENVDGLMPFIGDPMVRKYYEYLKRKKNNV